MTNSGMLEPAAVMRHARFARLPRQQIQKHFFPAPGDGIPIELLAVLAACFSKIPALLGTREQFSQPHKQFSRPNRPGSRSRHHDGFWLIVISRDHRQAARRGFQQDFRRSFPGGWKQKNISLLILLLQLLRPQQAGQPDVAEPFALDPLFQFVRHEPFAHQDKIRSGKTGRGLQQQLRLLERPQRSHKQHSRARVGRAVPCRA